MNGYSILTGQFTIDSLSIYLYVHPYTRVKWDLSKLMTKTMKIYDYIIKNRLITQKFAFRNSIWHSGST